MREVVVVRPDWSDTACKWGAEQLKRKTVAYAAQYEWKVKDLYASKANRADIMEEAQAVTYASVLGHGNEDMYTANLEEPVFWRSDAETESFCKNARDLAINFLSCLVAKRLLPWMISKGLRVALGYEEEFVFAIDENKFPNGVAEAFFACHCSADLKVFAGATMKEAWDYRQACWEKAISEADDELKRYLIHDYNCDAILGDGAFIPAEPEGPEPTPKRFHIKGDFTRESDLLTWIVNGTITLEGTAEIEETT